MGRPVLEQLQFNTENLSRWQLHPAELARAPADVLRAAAARCQLRRLSLSGDFSRAESMAAPLGEMGSLAQLELHDWSYVSSRGSHAGALAFLQAVAPVLQRLQGLLQLSLVMPPGAAAADALAAALPRMQALRSLSLRRLEAPALRGAVWAKRCSS